MPFNISVSFTNDNYCTIAITRRTTLLRLDTVVRILMKIVEEENDNEENVTSYLILLLSLHPNRKSNGTQSDEIEEV